MHASLRIAGSLAVLSLITVACGDYGTNPAVTDQRGASVLAVASQADTGEFELCKVGPRSLFRTVIDGVPQTPRFRLGPDACVVIATTAQLGVGNHTITVFEDVLTGQGQVLDSIVSTSRFVGNPNPTRGAPVTGTNQVTQTFNGDRGWLVQFYNH